MINSREAAAALVLGYECVALTSSGKLPTLTALCQRYPWLRGVAVSALVAHLLMPRPVVVVVRENASGQ